MDQQGAAGGDGLRRFAVRAGIYAGVFAAGALLAFLYSYIPLHNAKNWRIDYLEERLAAKDAELESLGEELRRIEADLEDVPDRDTFKVLQDELVSADKTVKRLEQQVARLEDRAKEAERSRDQWKARHAEAEQARVAARSEPRPAAAPAPDAATPAPDAAAPAAPAGAARTIASDRVVAVGARWRSPDGKSDFDLVAIGNGRARVVPDASQLRPGVVPTTREVAAGERFALDGPSGDPREVLVKRIVGTASIVIDVSE